MHTPADSPPAAHTLMRLGKFHGGEGETRRHPPARAGCQNAAARQSRAADHRSAGPAGGARGHRAKSATHSKSSAGCAPRSRGISAVTPHFCAAIVNEVALPVGPSASDWDWSLSTRFGHLRVGEFLLASVGVLMRNVKRRCCWKSSGQGFGAQHLQPVAGAPGCWAAACRVAPQRMDRMVLTP